MPTKVSDSTLEQFRAHAAGSRPTPAGVAVGAVSASFAFGLIAKVLAVGARHETPAGGPAKLESLAAAVHAGSTRLLQLADEDVTAFEAYLAGARLPHTTDRERLQRRRIVDSAVGRAIDLPLAAAREATAGLQLCGEALNLAPLALIADLGAAASLLAGGLRAFLMCAESNVRLLPSAGSACREQVAREAARSRQTLRRANELLERIAATLAGAAPPSTEK